MATNNSTCWARRPKLENGHLDTKALPKWNCNQLREQICSFLATKEITQTSFLQQIEVNSNSFRRFMGLRGRYNNKENGTYYGALVFFWDRSNAAKTSAANTLVSPSIGQVGYDAKPTNQKRPRVDLTTAGAPAKKAAGGATQLTLSSMFGAVAVRPQQGDAQQLKKRQEEDAAKKAETEAAAHEAKKKAETEAAAHEAMMDALIEASAKDHVAAAAQRQAEEAAAGKKAAAEKAARGMVLAPGVAGEFDSAIYGVPDKSFEIEEDDGTYRSTIVYRHLISDCVVLSFKQDEYEGLDGGYTFESGVLRDSDGDEIKFRLKGRIPVADPFYRQPAAIVLPTTKAQAKAMIARYIECTTGGMTDFCSRSVRDDMRAEEQARLPVFVTRAPPPDAANAKCQCDQLLNRKVKIRREGVTGQRTEDWKPVKNGVKDGKVAMVIKGENWNRLGTTMPLIDSASAWWRLRILSNDGSVQLDMPVDQLFEKPSPRSVCQRVKLMPIDTSHPRYALETQHKAQQKAANAAEKLSRRQAEADLRDNQKKFEHVRNRLGWTYLHEPPEQFLPEFLEIQHRHHLLAYLKLTDWTKIESEVSKKVMNSIHGRSCRELGCSHAYAKQALESQRTNKWGQRDWVAKCQDLSSYSILDVVR